MATLHGGVIGLAILAAGAAYAGHRSNHPGLCRAIDGDTIICGGDRIRLNGIDAPEMPGHCRRGRICVAGDPYASRDNLVRLLRRGDIEIIPLKTDRYGRTVAQVTAGGLDLSCAQLDYAEYVSRWDEGGRTAAACE